MFLCCSQPSLFLLSLAVHWDEYTWASAFCTVEGLGREGGAASSFDTSLFTFLSCRGRDIDNRY